MEDVWEISREYHRGQKKNANKLPNELVKKMIQYATVEGDTVCDFFMGNFTSAYVAHGLNRKVIGFELNKEACDYHVPILRSLKAGYMLKKDDEFDEAEQKAA
jgi:DNA modification methylase